MSRETGEVSRQIRRWRDPDTVVISNTIITYGLHKQGTNSCRGSDTHATADHDRRLSERIFITVAEALDTDPAELPPLERTISADALDRLFHRKNHPLGARTGLPYSGLWVAAYTDGNIDVFETYRAATIAERLPNDDSGVITDEPAVVLHFRDERYAFHEDRLDVFHEIITEAEDSDEAWEEMAQFARRQTTE